MRQCRVDRMEAAKRFRAMLADLGLKHLDAATLLHVSLRTLQNWLSGRHEVPYSAYKLLRLMRYMELPGESWRGWHFSRGQLVTPEGRTISGREGVWWSLLVRQAQGFGQLYRENLALKADLAPHGFAASEAQPPLRAAGAPVLPSSASGVPVTRHFSLMGETFNQKPRLAAVADFPRELRNQNLPCYEMCQTAQKASFELSRRPPAGAMGGR